MDVNGILPNDRGSEQRLGAARILTQLDQKERAVESGLAMDKQEGSPVA